MKANELRIGNWISDQGYETTVFQIDETHVNDDLMLDHFKPIPLTEEWLVRFGFEKVQSLRENHCNYSIDIIKRNSKSHYFPNLVWYQKKGFALKNIYIGYDLKYVHQLQNLYFALTGEELELK